MLKALNVLVCGNQEVVSDDDEDDSPVERAIRKFAKCFLAVFVTAVTITAINEMFNSKAPIVEANGYLQKLWMPLLIGLFINYISYIMVYLDSHVPGENPQAPFSPNKDNANVPDKKLIHLNYIFPSLLGIFVTIYLYYYV